MLAENHGDVLIHFLSPRKKEIFEDFRYTYLIVMVLVMPSNRSPLKCYIQKSGITLSIMAFCKQPAMGRSDIVLGE